MSPRSGVRIGDVSDITPHPRVRGRRALFETPPDLVAVSANVSRVLPCAEASAPSMENERRRDPCWSPLVALVAALGSRLCLQFVGGWKDLAAAFLGMMLMRDVCGSLCGSVCGKGERKGPCLVVTPPVSLKSVGKVGKNEGPL